MKTIIHDLDKTYFNSLIKNNSENIKIISDNGNIHKCTGCFGCWIKTPSECVIKDEYSNMGELMSKSSDLIIISRCVYGSYSPFVKNVIDRSISYILPYFTVINSEMHHKKRYNHFINMKVFFYGQDITDREKETASNLVKANAVNFYAKQTVVFLKDAKELQGDMF